MSTNIVYTAAGLPAHPFPAADYSRASNSISYFLPADLGGIYGQFMYAFDEKTSYSPGSATPRVLDPRTGLPVADDARKGRFFGGRASYSGVKYKHVAAAGHAEPKADKFALGYVHNLSRRTALYGSVAYIKNKNGASERVGGPAFEQNAGSGRLRPDSSTGHDLGLRHGF